MAKAGPHEARRFRHVLVGRGGGAFDAQGTHLKRFGFVTTNSLSQAFQRRAMEKYLKSRFAIDGDCRSSVDEGDPRCGGGARPDASDELKSKISAAAEELDALRKAVNTTSRP